MSFGGARLHISIYRVIAAGFVVVLHIIGCFYERYLTPTWDELVYLFS